MGNHRQSGVGLFGLGVIGTSVYKTLTEVTHSIRQEINGTCHQENVLVKDPLKSQNVLTTYPELLISNPEVSVMIETIGEDSITLGLIQATRPRGKHVVTCNKEVMVKQCIME